MDDFRGLDTPQMSITFHDYYEDTNDGPEYRMLQGDEPFASNGRTFLSLDNRSQATNYMSSLINFAPNLSDDYQQNLNEIPNQVVDFFGDQENVG